MIPEKSYVYVDTYPDGKNRGRVNLTHILFRATAPETTLTLTDEEAKPGEKNIFNYIMLKPYYED